MTTMFGFIVRCKDFDCKYNHETEQFSLVENGSRGYYMQVLLSTYASGRMNCVFIYYFKKSDTTIEYLVQYDPSYVDQKINHLKRFYFQKMLPFLTNQIRSGALDLPETEMLIK